MSLYDFKTRFSAGFSMPFRKTAVTCNYEPSSPQLVSIEKDAKIFGNVEDKPHLATLQKAAKVEVKGKCQ